MTGTKTVDLLCALAQETRLEVFRLLVRAGPGGLRPNEIVTAVGVAPATLSFHLKELRTAGLVTSERDGRAIVYRASFDTMSALVSYLMENCCQGVATGAPRNESFNECATICPTRT